MRTLVTGGAGFIGSNVVDALLAAGDEVTVLDDLSTGRRENVAASATLAEADVGDAAAVAAVFAAARPQRVLHLAAQIDVRRSVADPVFDARSNVGGTAAVLEAARSVDCGRVVMASTGGALYGDTERVPSDEDTPQRPLSPYGQSKAAAEGYLRLYAELYGMSTLALRLANVYGPRQDPRGEAGVIALFCLARAEGRPATVYGDGTQTRDFVFVADVVAAFLAAAGAADVVGALNVGTGVETSVNELTETLALPAEPAPARAGEVQRSCLDVGAAQAALGWRARTSLADGLEWTMDWLAGALA